MFRPERPTRRLDVERHENSEPSLLERLRTMPGGKPLLAVIAVFGQLSLYVPKRIEITPKPSAAVAERITTEAEAENFIAGALPGDVDVHVAGDTVVLTDTSHPEASQYTEFVFPGEQVSNDFSVNMRWAGRSYERGANAADGEMALMEAGVQQGVDAQLRQLEHLGVTPNDLIVDVSIVSQGLASPEGTKTGNIQASQQRAQLGLEATTVAYQQRDIAPEKIHGEAIGSGAEGTIDEFVQALNNQALSNGGTLVSREQVIQLIKRIHDGAETDPALVELFQKHVAAHRRADISTVIQLADVVVRVPEVPGAVNPQTVSGLEYYAPRAERHRRPGQPEKIPPLGGDPQKAFNGFAEAITRTGEGQRTPQEIFDTILRLYAGVEPDANLVRAYNEHIALGEDVTIDAILQLADVVAHGQALPSRSETFSTAAGQPERLTAQPLGQVGSSSSSIERITTVSPREPQVAFEKFTAAVTTELGADKGVLSPREAFAILVRLYTGIEQNIGLREVYENTIAKPAHLAGALLIQIAELINQTLNAAAAESSEPIIPVAPTSPTAEPEAESEPLQPPPGGHQPPSGPTGGFQPPPPQPPPLPPLPPLPPEPPPLPPPRLPYAPLRQIFMQLKEQSGKPQSVDLPKKQYAAGLGPTKGETIGRAPSRQGFKRAARKHHTGKR